MHENFIQSPKVTLLLINYREIRWNGSLGQFVHLFLFERYEKKILAKAEEITWISSTIQIISLFWWLLVIALISIMLQRKLWWKGTQTSLSNKWLNESWVLQQSKVNLQSAGLPDTVDSCLGAEIGDPVKLQAKPNIFQSLFQAAFALHVVDPQTQPATEAVPSLYTIFYC